MNERVTVDFDEEAYYLDGEFWESWDNYGEQMAETINKELNILAEKNKELMTFKHKTLLLIKEKIKKYEKHLKDIQDEEFCPDRYIYEIKSKIIILKELKEELFK